MLEFFYVLYFTIPTVLHFLATISDKLEESSHGLFEPQSCYRSVRSRITANNPTAYSVSRPRSKPSISRYWS